MKFQGILVSVAVGAVISAALWASQAKAASITFLSTGDPVVAVCTLPKGVGQCTENGGILAKCPKTGKLPYLGLGATCTKYVAPSTGSYARFYYQMTSSYTETFVQNNVPPTFGGYFWLQAWQSSDTSTAISDSCGNAPGVNYYGIPYRFCLNQVPGNYWLTLSSGLFATSGEAEDWATNMRTPPEGV